jgi:transcriptional regulator with XRE-family HTH domain
MSGKPIEAGKIFRILRTIAGFSVSELAKTVGVSVPLLSLIEKGERTPSMELLKKVSIPLQVPLPAMITLILGKNDISVNGRRTNQIVAAVRGLVEMEEKVKKLILNH